MAHSSRRLEGEVRFVPREKVNAVEVSVAIRAALAARFGDELVDMASKRRVSPKGRGI